MLLCTDLLLQSFVLLPIALLSLFPAAYFDCTCLNTIRYAVTKFSFFFLPDCFDGSVILVDKLENAWTWKFSRTGEW